MDTHLNMSDYQPDDAMVIHVYVSSLRDISTHRDDISTR